MNSAKPSILIIDDNRDMGTMVKQGLRKSYEVDYAADGYTAQQLISANRYQLILCDIRMPFLNGLTLVEEFRKKDIKIPVIFVSAEINDENSKKALHLGAANLVAKPFQMTELKEKIVIAINTNLKDEETNIETDEMARGHIYNQLKTYYYDYEKMIYFIQSHNINLDKILEELEKKEVTGRCMLDDPEFLEGLKEKQSV